MRHPRSLVVALALLVLSVAACDLVPGDDTTGGSLVGTSWSVVSIDGEPTLQDGPPTMVFAPDGVSGTTGCNSYGGTFRTDGDAMTIAAGAMTEMACDGPRGDQETRFIAALPKIERWQLREDGFLELSGAATLVAEPVEPVVDPPPADGDGDTPVSDLAAAPEWVLVAIDGNEDLADIVPTLSVAPDGSVSGFGGCNRFNGRMAVDGATVVVGPLASTKVACGAPGDLVERRYLEVLGAAARWSIDANGRLILEGDAGSLMFAAG
jgi:heat shock protein HslJ